MKTIVVIGLSIALLLGYLSAFSDPFGYFFLIIGLGLVLSLTFIAWLAWQLITGKLSVRVLYPLLLLSALLLGYFPADWHHHYQVSCNKDKGNTLIQDIHRYAVNKGSFPKDLEELERWTGLPKPLWNSGFRSEAFDYWLDEDGRTFKIEFLDQGSQTTYTYSSADGRWTVKDMEWAIT